MEGAEAYGKSTAYTVASRPAEGLPGGGRDTGSEIRATRRSHRPKDFWRTQPFGLSFSFLATSSEIFVVAAINFDQRGFQESESGQGLDAQEHQNAHQILGI